MAASENSMPWPVDGGAHDLLQRLPLAIALLDEAGAALHMNERFERSYGSEVFGSAPLQALLREPLPGWQTLRVRGRERGEVEIKAQVFKVQDNPILILEDASDTGLLRQLEQLNKRVSALERLSAIDGLTGAWNRAHLDRVIVTEMDRSIRTRQPVSLILLDVDHFKRVNDRYGHQAGDAVLCEAVRVIGATVRAADTLFRWGGEEFVVLAASAGYRAGAKLAEKMRAALEQHDFAGVGPVTASLGVAEHIATENAEIWFGRVDAALYRAKNEGRNRVSTDERGSSDLWAAASGPSVIRLEWQEAYECGNAAIDDEHRELFDLANALLSVSLNAHSSPEALGAALDTLLAHVAQHFADEEALLEQRDYPDLESHRRAHAGLLERAGVLKKAVAAGKASFGNLVDFLANNVIAQHMFKVDRKFFHLFKNG